MEAKRLAAAFLLCALSILGCTPFRIAMTFEPLDAGSQTSTLSREELSMVIAATSETAEAFGLEADPRLSGPSGLRERTEAGEDWSFALLARYKRADKQTAYSRVELQVSRNKSTGEVTVLLIDRDGDSYNAFTEELESQLQKKLRQALPTRRILLRRL